MPKKPKIKKSKHCKWCQKEFIPQRKDTKCCSKNCSSSNSASLARKRLKQTGLRKDFFIENPIEQILIKEVEAFVMRIKNQNFDIDVIDCFRLVDLFDKVFPKLENVPHRTNVEKSVNEMFIRLARWLNVKKQQSPNIGASH